MKKIYSLLFLVLFNCMAFAQIQLTVQPTSTYVCGGQSVTFIVEAMGNNLEYQWYYEGAPITGANSSFYTIQAPTEADSGSYYCVISNENDPSVQSDFATLTVTEATHIIGQSDIVGACYADSATLTVMATGVGLSYQWYKGTTAVGENSGTFTIPFVDFSSSGSYHVEVMNACQSVISQVITVTVDTAPNINAVNVPSEACAGDTVNLGVSASGTNLHYQWFHNDVLVSTANSFSIANCTAADSGIYQIVVKNGCSEIFSYVNLNVNTPMAPTGEANQNYIEGQTLANLEVFGGGEIKWYASAQNAADHENALPITTPLQDGVTYFATETVAGSCESNTSLAVTVTLLLGVGQVNDLTLVYFPNPVTAYFNFSSKESIATIGIFNMLGQKIAFQNVNAVSGNIDLTALPTGNYVAEFSSGNLTNKIKIVKQ